jgi:hypothetical protein
VLDVDGRAIAELCGSNAGPVDNLRIKQVRYWVFGCVANQYYWVQLIRLINFNYLHSITL